MAEIVNTFLKSKMNQDLDSRLLPNGEYREAINLMISKSEGDGVGEFENILGNNQIAALLPASSGGRRRSIIGHYVDETENVAYLIATDFENVNPNARAESTSNCGIYKINLSSPFDVSTLVLGSFLNFNKSFSVYGINLIENFLYWTDNNNQPRKINVNLAETNFVSITNQHYSTEEQISVAKYAPYQTPILMERSSTTITDPASAGATTLVVASNSGIKIGDIITDHDKQGASELIIALTVVTNINATTITFTPALADALPDDFAIDFSRPSMTNQGDVNLSNHSTQTITSLPGAAPNLTIRIQNPSYGGLPRVGDFITKVAAPPVTFTNNIKVVSVALSSQLGVPRWDITVDNSVTGLLIPNDVIEIAKNPNYLASWKGDPAFLEDKFVRFSYRFQYEDNEYSLMAPFSQIAFIPKQYSEFGAGQLNELDVLNVNNTSGGTETLNNYSADMTNAYKSSIISWFENDTDNINVRIPLPYISADLLASNLKIKNIEVLYKESDALSVKVLDSIQLTNPTPVFSNIVYEDDLHGFVTQYFYDYNYKSSKPFRTLPEGQTTRVYDRVPVKALAQEFVGSRVVYGNYLEKLTPPSSIPYNVGVNDKRTLYDNYTQYPYHTLKQNRTYQAGFVLSDIYGRQSDVILSSNDNSTTTGGSTVFLPYNTTASQSSSPIFDWIGKALIMSVEQPIATTVDYATGEPGLYADGITVSSINLETPGTGYALRSNSATTNEGASGGSGLTVAITSVNAAGAITGIELQNPGSGYVNDETLSIDGGTSRARIKIVIPVSNPLGWYSYKVVVKQQEQEYYNVFLPGFVNGLPVIASTNNPPTYTQDLDIYAFSTIIGDNINKIPRSLDEVGPTDLEFNSEELLYIRVNNPNIFSSTNAGPLFLGNQVPRNVQYFPGNLSQNVLNIATARDTELVAIPFLPNVQAGAYGQTNNATPSPTSTVTLTGSVPWGITGANVSFYGTDQNPFILKFSTSNQSTNPIGAEVTSKPSVYAGGAPSFGLHCMAPILTVAETKPVSSLLDIYWETSLTGLITVLNNSINNTFNGVTGLTVTDFTFPEDIAVSSVAFSPGAGFQAIDGSGAVIVTGQIPLLSIESIRPINSSSNLDAANWPFELVVDNNFRWRIGTTSSAVNSQFVFIQNSLPTPSINDYVINIRAKYDASGVMAEAPITYFNVNANLTNTIPTINNCQSVEIDLDYNDGVTVIKDIDAKNGSPITPAANATLNDQTGLVFNLGTVVLFNTATVVSNVFVLDSQTGELTAQGLIDLTSYSVPITVTDANGFGDTSTTCTLLVSVGAQHVPRPICGGRLGNIELDTCFKNSEWLFSGLQNNQFTPTSAQYPNQIPYPSGVQTPPPFALYNVLAQSNASTGLGCDTGALTQGSMTLIPTLYGGDQPGSDSTIKFWIQYRALNGTQWTSATPAVNSPSTVTGGFLVNAAGAVDVGGQRPASSLTATTYIFSLAGEYRVVTDNLRGGSCAQGGKPAFYVDFSDASYPGVACGVLNPCT